VETLREQLLEALNAAYANASVRAIVIGSAGKNFSVGGDLSHVAGREAGQSSYTMMAGVGEVALAVRNSPKPVVAAVTGHCIGAGAGLALLCDTVVMGNSAAMGFPYLKIGLVPDFGLSHTLAERIGLPAARQVLLFAKTFKADEAAAVGLADEVVEDERVGERALQLATMLAEAPAHALLLLRRMIRDGSASLETMLDREAAYQSTCFGSADVQEGIAAFKEKRKPDFVRS
ncbi:MAG: enoyl-CoA hydratase/isomerase family protein, partial [Legionella sp.]|nr:enoyl-CoA hydratase/isomerase family protein [Legionella sp.]